MPAHNSQEAEPVLNSQPQDGFGGSIESHHHNAYTGEVMGEDSSLARLPGCAAQVRENVAFANETQCFQRASGLPGSDSSGPVRGFQKAGLTLTLRAGSPPPLFATCLRVSIAVRYITTDSDLERRGFSSLPVHSPSLESFHVRLQVTGCSFKVASGLGDGKCKGQFADLTCLTYW